MKTAMAIPVVATMLTFLFVGVQLTKGDDPSGLEATPAPFSPGPVGEGTLVPLFPQDSTGPYIEINGYIVELPEGAQVVTIAGMPEIVGVELDGSRIFWEDETGVLVENSVQPEEQARLQPILDELQ